MRSNTWKFGGAEPAKHSECCAYRQGLQQHFFSDPAMLSHLQPALIGRFALEPMDKVFLTGLRVSTIIGIYPEERVRKQPIVLDLELACDIRQAAGSGDIKHALDYHALSLVLVEFVEKSRYGLIEAMAEDIATLIQTQYGVPWLKLTLHKPEALSHSDDVGLIIERGEIPAV